MSAPVLAALALGLGVLVLLLRHRPTVPWVLGLAGLAAVLLGAWAMPIDDRVAIGGEVFATTAYLRLFLVLLAITGGVLTLVGWAAGLTRALPGLVLVWFSAAATGLAAAAPLPAILILTTGSVVPVLGGASPGAEHDARVLGRGLRAVVVAGLLAAVAFPIAGFASSVLEGGAGLVTTPGAAGSASAPGAIGLAFLMAAGGLALRAGAVPLHGWLGRLSEALAAPAIPVIFAWGPAALAIVLLGWGGDGLELADQPLVIERLLVTAVALASLVLGAVAAFLHDDLEHVVGYSLVADAGVLLLALATLDPAGSAAARAWILAYVVARSAFAAWTTALALAYGTRRIPELAGWARRSPLLAGSLVVIGLAIVGVPGLAAFDARARIIDLSLDGPFDLVATVGIVASAGYFGRLLLTGVRGPSGQVAAAVDLRPAWPGARPTHWRDLVEQTPTAIRRNRRPAAALAVLGLALLGLGVAAGGFRGPSLAAQPGPAASPSPSPATPAPSGTPSPGPAASPTSPSGSPTTPGASPNGSPGASADPSAAPSGDATPGVAAPSVGGTPPAATP